MALLYHILRICYADAVHTRSAWRGIISDEIIPCPQPLGCG